MRRAAPLLLALLLVGCKGSREKEMIGTWRTSEGATTELTAGGAMTKSIGRLVQKGTWKLEGDVVTETVTTMNGVSPSELKSRMQARFPNPPAQIKKVMDDLDKPNVYKLSSDSKSMTTDPSRDKNSGPAVTWTKG